jgi:DnaJ homolog subfamily A member 5
LVEFVKKWDPRWKKLIRSVKESQNPTNTPISPKRDDQKRFIKQTELSEIFEEQEWMKIDEEILYAIEDRIAQMELDSRKDKKDRSKGMATNMDSTHEDSDKYCIACNRVFRSQMQFENHERSAKHKRQLEALRKNLLKEEEGFQDARSFREFDSSDTSSSFYDSAEDQPSSNLAADRIEPHEVDVTPHGSDNEGSSDVSTIFPIKFSKKRSKKPSQKSSTDIMFAEIYVLEGGTVDNPVEKLTSSLSDTTQSYTHEQTEKSYRSIAERKSKSHSKDSHAKELKCHICGTCFDSRNQLFRHIRETNHVSASNPFDHRKRFG